MEEINSFRGYGAGRSGACGTEDTDTTRDGQTDVLRFPVSCSVRADNPTCSTPPGTPTPEAVSLPHGRPPTAAATIASPLQ